MPIDDNRARNILEVILAKNEGFWPYDSQIGSVQFSD
jgi:hypothetical protein